MTNILSVSGLNRYIKSVFDGDFRLKDLFLQGEISNFNDHIQSGHLYFTLKDNKGAIKAVMFKSYAQNINFDIYNGMNVIVRCSVSLYERDGTYQIYVYDIEPSGFGKLFLEYNQLVEKLSNEGLFSDEFKKEIPLFPDKIAVVTSPTGAALQDILNVLRRRYPIGEVTVYPCTVQGNGGAESIIKALQYIEFNKTADVIIIARGGGSIEDLWEFNNENLARAIFECQIPIISGVGHETDTTICDLVADVRVPTPSAAGEIVAQNIDDIKFNIYSLQKNIYNSVQSKVKHTKQQLEKYNIKNILNMSLKNLEISRNNVSNINNSINMLLNSILNENKTRFIHCVEMIEELNPINLIKKGYTLTYLDNKPIFSIDDVDIDDIIETRGNGGKIISVVKSKITEEI